MAYPRTKFHLLDITVPELQAECTRRKKIRVAPKNGGMADVLTAREYVIEWAVCVRDHGWPITGPSMHGVGV
jgi:hypothetical protein